MHVFYSKYFVQFKHISIFSFHGVGQSSPSSFQFCAPCTHCVEQRTLIGERRQMFQTNFIDQLAIQAYILTTYF